MSHFRGQKVRHPLRICQVCGRTLRPGGDCIRLKGRRFYCAAGECKRTALRIIEAARVALG